MLTTQGDIIEFIDLKDGLPTRAIVMWSTPTLHDMFSGFVGYQADEDGTISSTEKVWGYDAQLLSVNGMEVSHG